MSDWWITHGRSRWLLSGLLALLLMGCGSRVSSEADECEGVSAPACDPTTSTSVGAET